MMVRLRWVLICLLILLLAAFSFAQSKPKKKLNRDVPSALVKAHWVFITSYTEDGAGYTSKPDSADLATIEDVRKALRDWGYYKEVNSAEMADLVIAVRKKENPVGARAGSGIGISIPGGVTLSQPRSIGGGPAEDAMSVFEGSGGKNGVVIWKRMEKNGLHLPKMSLFTQFRDFVESGTP